MTKIFSVIFLSLMLILTLGGFGTAHAQVATFPVGCTSTVGTSTTTGMPCNGTGTATTSFAPGCTSIFGFSTTTGLACNGGFSATTTFFPGCTSIFGYSTQTGLPCNGGVTASSGFLPGCTSTLGSSAINGFPCSGGTTPLSFLSGCSSVFGFSTVNGLPCNGTSSAIFDPGMVLGASDTPGLPQTGEGGNATSNMIMLISSGLVALMGVIYLARVRKS